MSITEPHNPFNNPEAARQAFESLTRLQRIVILYPIRSGGRELPSKYIRECERNELLREGLFAIVLRSGVRCKEANNAMERFFSRYQVQQPTTVCQMVAKVEEIFREKILPESLSFDEAYAKFEECLKTTGCEVELKKYASEWRTSQNCLVGDLAKRLYEIRVGRGAVEINQMNHPAPVRAAHFYMNGLIFLRENKIDEAEASFLSVSKLEGVSQTLCDLASADYIIRCSENNFDRAWKNFKKHKICKHIAFSIRRAWSAASDANLVRFSQMMGLFAEEHPPMILHEKASGMIEDPETQVSMKCWLLIQLVYQLRTENLTTAFLLIERALGLDGLSDLDESSARYAKAVLMTEKIKLKRDAITVEEVREILQLLFLVRSHCDFLAFKKAHVYLMILECMTLRDEIYLESMQNERLLVLLPDELKTEEGRVDFLNSLLKNQDRFRELRQCAAVALMTIYLATKQNDKLMLHCMDILTSRLFKKEIRLQAFHIIFSNSSSLDQIDAAILWLGKEVPSDLTRQFALRIGEEAEKKSSSEKLNLLKRAVFFFERLFPANWRQQGVLVERPGEISIFIDFLRAATRAEMELSTDRVDDFIKLLGEAFYTKNEKTEEFCKVLSSCRMQSYSKQRLLNFLIAINQNEWAVAALSYFFPDSLLFSSMDSLLDYCKAQVETSTGRRKAVLHFYIAQMLHMLIGQEEDEVLHYSLALASSEISDAEKIEIKKNMPLKRKASPVTSTRKRRAL